MFYKMQKNYQQNLSLHTDTNRRQKLMSLLCNTNDMKRYEMQILISENTKFFADDSFAYCKTSIYTTDTGSLLLSRRKRINFS